MISNRNSIPFGGRALRGVFASVLFLLAATLAVPQANAQETADIALEAQPLENALIELSSQAGVGIFAPGELVEGLQARPLSGNMTMEDALRQLLDGTGLSFQRNADGSYVVMRPTTGQRRPGIEEIIVTGQKREERIQDVPIAISAFSPEDLEAQKIEGGFDLLKGVPNVTFSKTNFSGYNFQIRGIGTQAISATTDPGVAVSQNNTTLIVNRLFEQEYLDVERVEVLRGPQGTLFGRNATAGVINVITKKPEMGVWDGMIDVEVGNFNARRLRGFFNAPIGDTLAIRGAYASTKRDGFGINEAADDPLADVSRDVDNRDLWTGRLTLGWQPNDRFRLNFLWERFEEDDNRVRTSKQLCHRDTRARDRFVDENGDPADVTSYIDGALSQGCMGGSLYSDDAFNTPNGASLAFVSGLFRAIETGMGIGSFVGGAQGGIGGNPNWRFRPFFEPGAEIDPDCEAEAVRGHMFPIDICRPDVYGGRQSRDLRTISSLIQPKYRATADIFELSFDYELSDELLLSSQSVYVEDEYYATQDFNRFQTQPIWTDSTEACDGNMLVGFGLAFLIPDCSTRGTWGDIDGDGVGYYANLTPGGVLCDPQLGCSDKLFAQDLSQADSTQFNQEVRLVSSYSGDWNFSLGANFTRFETQNDYYVFANALTLTTYFWPFNHHNSDCIQEGTLGEPDGSFCRYVDPNPLEDINGEGHNYFRSDNPYELTSQAIFGELYWQATDTIKFTAGLRLTWDRKVFTPVPSQLLLGDYREIDGIPPDAGPEACARGFAPAECPLAGNATGGRGSPSNPDIVQEWREPTGRLVVDWQPLLGFTDETLIYASYAHGYKGGGANPPSIAPPAGLLAQEASGGFAAPPDFQPEYVDALELGTKNTLFGGALVLNGTAFFYDYKDYQVSKIVDRSAFNENFDSEVWGLELETIFAPSLDWQFNAAIGYLSTRVDEGEESIDIMDRTDGGNRKFVSDNPNSDWPEGFDEWVVIQPFPIVPSNCIVPANLVQANLTQAGHGAVFNWGAFCPTGNPAGLTTAAGVAYFDEDGNFSSGLSSPTASDRAFNHAYDSPNGGQGFAKDLGGNDLPNAPRFTVALGGQYNFDLTRDWRATARVDYYWQDESYARIYNFEPYDRLKSWSNTNLSFWVNNPVNGITVEAYVKNVFDETPITGSFLNSDDTALTTNVFTLEPRLIGVSIRKEF